MSVKMSLDVKVEVAGTWTSTPWQPTACQLSPDGIWEKELNLGEGVYEYKFLVNGVWFLDSSKPTVSHDDGITNNVLVVKKKDDFEEVTNKGLVAKKLGRNQGVNFDGSTSDVESKDESDLEAGEMRRGLAGDLETVFDDLEGGEAERPWSEVSGGEIEIRKVGEDDILDSKSDCEEAKAGLGEEIKTKGGWPCKTLKDVFSATEAKNSTFCADYFSKGTLSADSFINDIYEAEGRQEVKRLDRKQAGRKVHLNELAEENPLGLGQTKTTQNLVETKGSPLTEKDSNDPLATFDQHFKSSFVDSVIQSSHLFKFLDEKFSTCALESNQQKTETDRDIFDLHLKTEKDTKEGKIKEDEVDDKETFEVQGSLKWEWKAAEKDDYVEIFEQLVATIEKEVGSENENKDFAELFEEIALAEELLQTRKAVESNAKEVFYSPKNQTYVLPALETTCLWNFLDERYKLDMIREDTNVENHKKGVPTAETKNRGKENALRNSSYVPHFVQTIACSDSSPSNLSHTASEYNHNLKEFPSMVAHTVCCTDKPDMSIGTMASHSITSEPNRSFKGDMASMIAHTAQIQNNSKADFASTVAHVAQTQRELKTDTDSMIAHTASILDKTKTSTKETKTFPSMIAHVVLLESDQNLDCSLLADKETKAFPSMIAHTVAVQGSMNIDNSLQAHKTTLSGKVHQNLPLSDFHNFEDEMSFERSDEFDHEKGTNENERTSKSSESDESYEFIENDIESEVDVYSPKEEIDLKRGRSSLKEVYNVVDHEDIEPTLEKIPLLSNSIGENESGKERTREEELTSLIYENEKRTIEEILKNTACHSLSEGHNCIGALRHGFKLAIQDSVEKYFQVSSGEDRTPRDKSSAVEGLKISYPWKLQLRNNWQSKAPILDLLTTKPDRLEIELPMMVGSYQHQFLVNGFNFCDKGRPYRMSEEMGGLVNYFTLWSHLPSEDWPGLQVTTKLDFPFKVQIRGSWGEQEVGCTFNVDGTLVAQLPPLDPGIYNYHFTINGQQFCDKSRFYQQYLFGCYHLLQLTSSGIVNPWFKLETSAPLDQKMPLLDEEEVSSWTPFPDKMVSSCISVLELWEEQEKGWEHPSKLSNRFNQPSEKLLSVSTEQAGMVDAKKEGGMSGNVGKDEKEEGSVSEPKNARTANTFPQNVQGVGIRSV